MESPTESDVRARSSPVRSRAKTACLSLATAVVAYAAIELLSLALFRFVDSEPFTFERLEQARDGLRDRSVADISEPEAVSTPRHVENKFVHPYVGFVQDPSGRPPNVPGMGGLSINRWGYVDSAEPFHTRSDDKLVIGIVGGSVARDFSFLGVGPLVEHLSSTLR